MPVLKILGYNKRNRTFYGKSNFYSAPMKKKFYKTMVRSWIKNAMFSISITLRELLKFGHKKWWWKLVAYPAFLYLPDSGRNVSMRESIHYGNYSFVNFGFGETPPSTLKKIIESIDYQDYNLFVDLGSGRGKAVLTANILYDLKGIGIELLPTHVCRSRKLKQAFGIEQVEFLQKDIFNSDLSKKGIYYVVATSFDEPTAWKLNEKFKEIPMGSTIITVHHKLTKPEFKLTSNFQGIFSWGFDQVYFYRRV